MKLAIIGGRDFRDYELLEKEADKLSPCSIVSGGAVGADSLAKRYAIERGLEIVEFLPEYGLYGRAAPIKRNFKIVEYSDIVLAFWNGVSRGTKSSIDMAKRKGKNVIIVNY